MAKKQSRPNWSKSGKSRHVLDQHGVSQPRAEFVPCAGRQGSGLSVFSINSGGPFIVRVTSP